MATLEKTMKEHGLTVHDIKSSSYIQVFDETPEQFADRELAENPESYATREDVFEELKSDSYHVGGGYIVLIAP